VSDYARIHAKGDAGVGGKKLYSTIGILASDFSKGKGEKNVKADANISPPEARYIFEWVKKGLGTLDGVVFSSEKIFGNADGNGYAPVRKLTIGRSINDNSGKPRNAPWYVIVENGVGEKAHNSNGGTYCKSGSYKRENQVFVYLTDQDFYCQMSAVVEFIGIWEIAYGAKLIREGHLALQHAIAQNAPTNDAQEEAPPTHHQAHQEAPQHTPPPPTQPQQHQSQTPQPPQHKPSQSPPPTAQASQPPQQTTPQPSPQQPQAVITIEEARNLVISVGKHKGKTLGALEYECPSDVDWYVTEYYGNNDKLRGAAGVIMANRAA